MPKCHVYVFFSIICAVANGLNPERAFVCPIGVDQEIHTILNQSQLASVSFSGESLNKLSPHSVIGFVARYWDKPAYTLRKRYGLIDKVVSILADLDLPIIILGPGWDQCPSRVRNANVIYCQTKYKYYPLIYNKMKVFASLSLHEGGPMPLLGSMSCGVFPVVTNTGFAYDVLAPDLIESLISTDAGPAEIVNLILSKYFSMSDRARYREIDGEFTFEKAAMKIFDHMY